MFKIQPLFSFFLLASSLSLALAVPVMAACPDPQGAYITCYGFEAGLSFTTGQYNTAIGVFALRSNTTGGLNTALGDSALYSNTDGGYNTANGVNALYSNTIGGLNTANGVNALYSNIDGGYNTANGYQALYSNTSGLYNTADGVSALYSNTSGLYNIGVGYQAGINLTTGNYNIDIGNFGNTTDTRTIRIGSGTNQNKTFIAGISGKTATGGVQVFINSSGQLGTLTSSKRFKSDIKDLGTVSDKLMKLRPVEFRYKEAAEDGTHPLQYGLIAEEVAKVYPDLVQYDKNGKPFTVYYHLLTPLILNDLQKEHALNLKQQAETQQQNGKIASLQAENQALKAALKQQDTKLAALQQALSKLAMFVQTKVKSQPQKAIYRP